MTARPCAYRPCFPALGGEIFDGMEARIHGCWAGRHAENLSPICHRLELRRVAISPITPAAFFPQGRAIKKGSDMYKALDVLAQQVGILGIFSDWPATVTYYANCMGLR